MILDSKNLIIQNSLHLDIKCFQNVLPERLLSLLQIICYTSMILSFFYYPSVLFFQFSLLNVPFPNETKGI